MPKSKQIASATETLELLESFLDKLQQLHYDFSNAAKNKDVSALQHISRIIHSMKGSSVSIDLGFSPIICHNIEEALLNIKENGFTPEQSELAVNLFSLLEDYYISKKQNYAFPDEDFAVRMHSLFKASTPVNQLLHGLRGLIVDDSRTVAKTISNKLTKQGVFCSYASNGLDALNRITDEYFDFVVTGQHTKKINGFELIEILNISKGKNPHIKTCLISSAENLTPLKKSANLVLQKNASLTPSLIAFLQEEFKATKAQQPLRDFHKIMLVDDDPLTRKILHAVFAKEKNMQVEIVASGAEALNKVQTFHPEVIVLDCIMPGLSGQETLKALQVLNQLKDTRFYFLTGNTRPEEVSSLLALGAHDVLVKPFAPDRLVNSLKERYSSAA